MREENALAAYLASINGVGRRSLYKLLNESGSLKGIFDMSKEEIVSCVGLKPAQAIRALIGSGDTQYYHKCLERGTALLKRYESEGIRCISCRSGEFPQRLRKIPDPPFCIYVKGELPPLQMPCVAMIGARACSAYGRSVAYSYGKELALAGVGVISGMARGIDGIAQEGAVTAGGKTFAVLGGGVDYCYPAEHRGLYDAICQTGGVISEYVPGTEPRANFFPERNRIISGMADIVLVIEAKKRSGTYITVTQALEQGKEVYAVPGRVTDLLSDGCNSLIKDGAGLADSVPTILDALSSYGYGVGRFQTGSAGKIEEEVVGENDIRSRILSLLDLTPLHLNRIYEEMNKVKPVPMETLITELVGLELDGIAESCGNYYVKKC